MKIKDYPMVDSFDESLNHPYGTDVYAVLEPKDEDSETELLPLLGKSTQVEGIFNGSQSSMIHKLAELSDNVEDHRSTFRGKYLGESPTEEQRAAIADGSFTGLLLGDYWKYQGCIFRIADFDYWYGKGGGLTRPTEQHHVVVIPDMTYVLYAGPMKRDVNTDGGYVNSDMRSYLTGDFLAQAGGHIVRCFGDEYILVHDELLVNAVDAFDGMECGYVWCESKVEIPSELMIFGNQNVSQISDGVNIPAVNTIDTMQLALFRYCPVMCYSSINQMSSISNPYWLRNVVDRKNYAVAMNGWNPTELSCSGTIPIRPVFGVTGVAYPYYEREVDLLPMVPDYWLQTDDHFITLKENVPIVGGESYTIYNVSKIIITTNGYEAFYIKTLSFYTENGTKMSSSYDISIDYANFPYTFSTPANAAYYNVRVTTRPFSRFTASGYPLVEHVGVDLFMIMKKAADIMIQDISVLSKDQDPYLWEPGYVNTTNGENSTSNVYQYIRTMPYLRIDPTKSYYISPKWTDYPCFFYYIAACFYDQDRIFLSSYGYNAFKSNKDTLAKDFPYNLIIPDDAKYVRFHIGRRINDTKYPTWNNFIGDNLTFRVINGFVVTEDPLYDDYIPLNDASLFETGSLTASKGGWIDEAIINSSTGEVTFSDSGSYLYFRTTEYIPVERGSTYSLTLRRTDTFSQKIYVFFYTKNKVFMSVNDDGNAVPGNGISFDSTNVMDVMRDINIPKSACYIKIYVQRSKSITDISEIVGKTLFMELKKGGSIDVEKGVNILPLNPEAWINGRYDTSTGLTETPTNLNNLCLKDFYPIKKGTRYKITNVSGAGTLYGIYQLYIYGNTKTGSLAKFSSIMEFPYYFDTPDGDYYTPLYFRVQLTALSGGSLTTSKVGSEINFEITEV